MRAIDFQLGDVVVYCIRMPSGLPALCGTQSRTVEATIIMHDTTGVHQMPGNTLLGWTIHDPTICCWEKRKSTSWGHLMQPPFVAGYWIQSNAEFIWQFLRHGNLTGASALGPDGMTCASGRCRAFVPMAAPNQSDGSFLCYTCRQKMASLR